MNAITFYPTYLRWLAHLCERLGWRNVLDVWKNAFVGYDDALLTSNLSGNWHPVVEGDAFPLDDRVNELAAEFFPTSGNELTVGCVRELVENTPPVSQILRRFGDDTVKRAISAYDVLHLRFDGLACLAEALIERYQKQGEFIVYDLMIADRLASINGETGSVQEFIADFVAPPDAPSLFTAGLETELVSQSDEAATVYVRECEWARYFGERHPTVGYLMACSTDEAAFRAFNKCLRLQRTMTLMEGGTYCDFYVYAVDEKS
jgi:hypothetical protein